MELEFFEPSTIEEALELGSRFGETGCFVAGGTDLVIQMRRGRRQPSALVSLHKLQALHGIHTEDDAIVLGALVTHREIERHPIFAGPLRALVEAAEVIGGHQVRNVGTVGGNVCNASPAADLLPVLLTLDAQVHLRGISGERTLPLEGFLKGPGRTARAPGELVTAVSFEHPPQLTATAFIKFGRRRAMEISIASVAAAVTVDPRGGCVEARIAVGAASPTAIRIPAAEALLRADASDAVVQETARIAATVVAPLSDVRASAEYRRHLVLTLVPRALAKAMERAKQA